MNHTLSEQSLAVKEAKDFIVRLPIMNPPELPEPSLIDKLECAAQTLAALNWTKHLPDEGRDEYMTKLEGLVADWLEYWEETKRDEILAMSYDVIQSQSSELKEKEKRIAQLEEALKGILAMAREHFWESDYGWEKVTAAESLLNKTN